MFACNIGTSHFVGLAGTAARSGIGTAMFEIYVSLTKSITRQEKRYFYLYYFGHTSLYFVSVTCLWTFHLGCLFHLNVGLAVCSSVHGIRCLYYARIHEKTIWRQTNKYIPLSAINITLHLHKNLSKLQNFQ